ncbi:hypothetical protein Hanom_Chr03g00249491 [Helianthus anomalus]
MFVPNCRQCPLSLNLMSFVLSVSKSCTLCPLPLTQSDFLLIMVIDFPHHHHSSATSHRSISNTDTVSQLDEIHSSLRADSPLRSDDIISSTSTSTSTAIVTVDKFRSPIRSPISGTTSSPPPPPPLPSPSSPSTSSDLRLISFFPVRHHLLHLHFRFHRHHHQSDLLFLLWFLIKLKDGVVIRDGGRWWWSAAGEGGRWWRQVVGERVCMGVLRNCRMFVLFSKNHYKLGCEKTILPSCAVHMT